LIDNYVVSRNSEIKTKIEQKLQPDTPFTAFKIWIIKRNQKLTAEFKEYLTF